jgi:hypothetical protein
LQLILISTMMSSTCLAAKLEELNRMFCENTNFYLPKLAAHFKMKWKYQVNTCFAVKQIDPKFSTCLSYQYTIHVVLASYKIWSVNPSEWMQAISCQHRFVEILISICQNLQEFKEYEHRKHAMNSPKKKHTHTHCQSSRLTIPEFK